MDWVFGFTVVNGMLLLARKGRIHFSMYSYVSPFSAPVSLNRTSSRGICSSMSTCSRAVLFTPAPRLSTWWVVPGLRNPSPQLVKSDLIIPTDIESHRLVPASLSQKDLGTSCTDNIWLVPANLAGQRH
ncbi:MAG: hypothetical protein JRN45_00260 [Nitrososphaerota archaeon]|nr:hypothetical protein [Nitrososphaerota archaeon]